MIKDQLRGAVADFRVLVDELQQRFYDERTGGKRRPTLLVVKGGNGDAR